MELKKEKHEAVCKDTETSYEELIALCKLNIGRLLRIGFAGTDEHIDKHFNGEAGLLNVIEGYVAILDRFYELRNSGSGRQYFIDKILEGKN